MNRFPHDSWVLVKHVQSSTCERASLLACLAVAHRPVIFTATAAAATVDGAEQTRRRQQAVPYDVLEECKKMHTSAGHSLDNKMDGNGSMVFRIVLSASHTG